MLGMSEILSKKNMLLATTIPTAATVASGLLLGKLFEERVKHKLNNLEDGITTSLLSRLTVDSSNDGMSVMFLSSTETPVAGVRIRVDASNDGYNPSYSYIQSSRALFNPYNGEDIKFQEFKSDDPLPSRVIGSIIVPRYLDALIQMQVKHGVSQRAG